MGYLVSGASGRTGRTMMVTPVRPLLRTAALRRGSARATRSTPLQPQLRTAVPLVASWRMGRETPLLPTLRTSPVGPVRAGTSRTTPVRPLLRCATLVKHADGAEPYKATTFVRFVWTGDPVQARRVQLGTAGARSDTVGTLLLTVYDLGGAVAPNGVQFYSTVGSGARTGPYGPQRSTAVGAYDVVYERDFPLDPWAETLAEAEVTLVDGAVQRPEAVRFGPRASTA